ncbi:MAG: YggS family pyridoxal phosphate-dependent enzyme [Myxococcota bacterium]
MNGEEAWRERVRRGLAQVRGRLVSACEQARRDPRAIRLVAVSKVHPPAAVRAAYAEGQRDFGENYVQEMSAKAEALSDLTELRWRFVGHLQRNKARDVVRLGAAVETVDSSRLADAIDRRAAQEGRRLEVLIQVNVGGEAQKAGCAPDQVPALVAHVRGLDGLDLRGLMTVPPHTDDPEGARPFFRRLRELRDAHGLRDLSMGMTHDLEIAVQEGATIVRVGTAIFGKRS